MHAFIKVVSGPSVPPATRLEDLRLICNSTFRSSAIYKGDFLVDLILFGGSAPLLRTLVLYAVYVNWSQAWAQSTPNLQTLHLAHHERELRPTSAILLGAPNLRTLKLEESGLWDETEEPTEEPLLHLPNLLCSPVLKTLTLHFRVEIPNMYSDLVTLLVGPAIQVTPSSIGQPCSLLRLLETLNIEGLPCSPDCAKVIYRELVNLKVLKLSRLHTPQSFWDLLSPWQPDISRGMDFLAPKWAQAGSIVIYLPSLKDLFLTGVTIFELPKLVMGRRDAGVPLRPISTKRYYVTRLSDEVWLRDNLEKFEITEGGDDEEFMDSDSESGLEDW
ncbi:hypothetical protein SCLCIDRAFT_689857 [Scleroderma citrinum Foug A]|uniref:F-box domain-containing protein n=1 Tax=Scleroderma citrinum Foug A TaxID=1036808 RepID=A0A0C3AFR7_9AGAM|nr:hypothetical protein SCLCIDRAFT_689857 [Scleroderma citrinum Foug A]